MSELLDTNPDYKGNFYRALTNDRCDDRHGMLDPEMLADLCPLGNGRHDDGEHAFRPRSFSLGSLDILRAEILQDILVERADIGGRHSLVDCLCSLGSDSDGTFCFWKVR